MGTGNRILQFTLLISLMWIGCVKDPQDIPGGFTDDPAFGLAGSFDGQPLNLTAGQNGWTVQPVVFDEDSITVYRAVFSKDGCLDQCKPSWEFLFFGASPGSGNYETNFSNTVQTGPKDFVLSHQERDSFEISLAADPGLFMSGFSYWENLDGPVTTYHPDFRDVIGYGEYLNVCFQSLAFTGCQYNQCIYFNPVTLNACRASIVAKIQNDSTISLSVRPEGTAPFSFEWFEGSKSSSIVLPLQAAIVDIYAGVVVMDALGNRSELNQTIRVRDGIVDACYFPITLTSTFIPNVSLSFFMDKVEIKYTDVNGVEWSSTSGIQFPTSFMTIDQVEYYDVSPMNDVAYKVKLNTKVELFNQVTGANKSLLMQGATIALSHK